jgi:anti-sigma-K factor RskA
MTDEDNDGLAAEYALGTLDARERAQADERARTDPEFAAAVQSWEKRLGELHAMVEAAEPPPHLWDRIKEQLGEAGESAAIRLPEIPQPAAAPAGAGREAAVIRYLRRQVGQWQGATAAVSMLAAALAAIVVTAALAPGRLPEALRPPPKIVEVVRTVEAPVPAPSRFVAVLQSSPSAPAFILTVDLATRNLTVRRVGAEQQPGRSYELWLVSDRFPAPRSLGLVGAAEFSQPPALAAYDPGTISEATYAVSLEPEGGSPTGAPTGPVLWTGKLVESLPPPPDRSH